jgi:uncharacterized protein with NRDE domain
MCVIYLAINQLDDFPLILLANRDEYYDRPTAPAAWWDDAPDIFAGRDLVAGGTWLGINNSGRFAAVTNYRDPNAAIGKKSRGHLVSDFLGSTIPNEEYLENVRDDASAYSGFNLLTGEVRGLIEIFYYSNRGGEIRRLESGVYGLSNNLLDVPWPKVQRGRERFRDLLKSPSLERDRFFELLKDESLAEDIELPDTGIGYEREKLLSGIFIRTPVYGTRSSSVLTMNSSFEIELEERVFV